MFQKYGNINCIGRYICAVILAVFYISLFSMADSEKYSLEDHMEHPCTINQTKINSNPVIKKVLENGLTVLVHESHQIPKVSLEMWYDVGSKDEMLGEKGIAHLIEHMIFKGTDSSHKSDDEIGLNLSESDINVAVHKLSGTCNAFTSYDYTAYVFNFPTHHWREALPIIADCMVNCAFKDDMLNSEMKAVIQELKMNRDQYERHLLQEMIGVVFPDHPYHYPVIGYKHDLWTVKGKDLYNFYQKHYKPNNATFVVVGDVDPNEVFELAEKYFGTIVPDNDYKKKQHFFNKDIISKTVTMYRDVVQPSLFYMFVVPGASAKHDLSLEMFEWILGKGKSSRLYKKLVNESQLATDASVGFWNLFDHGVFFIMIDPKDEHSFDEIEDVVVKELEDLAENGITCDELVRGYKKTQMAFYSLLESIEDQAYQIGSTFLATGDENYVFSALNQPLEVFEKDINRLIRKYFRSSVMHKGIILPLPESEKMTSVQLQQESDIEDTEILAARVRITPVEPASYANSINVQKSTEFTFPKPEQAVLDNGIKLFSYKNSITPKINMVIEFKARSYYDPENKQGLYAFVTEMMTEGTKKYTDQELSDAIESRGMSLSVYPGGISLKMLHDDFEYGLDILKEILENATFPEQAIEKVREQLFSDIKQYWDEPRSFVNQIIRQEIYKGHPYSRQPMGTLESIASITREDLIEFYKRYIIPFGARIAVVGDIRDYKIKEILEETFQTWKSSKINTIEFPSLIPAIPQEINYPINRDQVVLCLAQLSIDRKDPDYDKYLLFDQIFGGGALGSMSSKLFELREHTGLFYTIRGSLLTGADEQPGMFQVRTIVSLDRLKEAEVAIKETIDTVIDTITLEEFEEAKRAIASALIDNFSSNSAIAVSFLYLDKYNFPADYFDNRIANIDKITLDDMKQAIKKALNSKDLITIRIGRV